MKTNWGRRRWILTEKFSPIAHVILECLSGAIGGIFESAPWPNSVGVSLVPSSVAPGSFWWPLRNPWRFYLKSAKWTQPSLTLMLWLRLAEAISMLLSMSANSWSLASWMDLWRRRSFSKLLYEYEVKALVYSWIISRSNPFASNRTQSGFEWG